VSINDLIGNSSVFEELEERVWFGLDELPISIVFQTGPINIQIYNFVDTKRRKTFFRSLFLISTLFSFCYFMTTCFVINKLIPAKIQKNGKAWIATQLIYIVTQNGEFSVRKGPNPSLCRIEWFRGNTGIG
jgi:hypothetical protein